MNREMIPGLTKEGPLKKSLISLLAALLVMFALPITGAFAASVTHQGQKINCVEQILPLQSGQLSSKVTATACFLTFSQAIAFATGGAVQLPAAQVPQNLTAAQMRSAKVRPFITTIVAYMYSDTGYGGSTLTISTTVSNPACASGYDYGLASMPTGWDDVVSSLKVSTAQDGCVYTACTAMRTMVVLMSVITEILPM